MREDDPNDKLEIGPIDVVDCQEAGGRISPAFRVRNGKSYLIELHSDGFDAEEVVTGIAGVEYTLFVELIGHDKE